MQFNIFVSRSFGFGRERRVETPKGRVETPKGRVETPKGRVKKNNIQLL